jgi:hypothetical protein
MLACCMLAYFKLLQSSKKTLSLLSLVACGHTTLYHQGDCHKLSFYKLKIIKLITRCQISRLQMPTAICILCPFLIAPLAIRLPPPLRPPCRSCGCHGAAVRGGAAGADITAAASRGERAIAIIAWRAPALSPRKCSFWTPSPNERLPPYPGLLIPCLHQSATIYHIIQS